MNSSSVLVYHVSIKIKCLCCCCSRMKVPQHCEAETISMLHNVYILSLLLSSPESGQAACSLLLCPRAAS